MTYPRKFFLNLTSDSISLAIKENQDQYVLDSFDPNEPAASEGLKKLFNLAKSLNSKTPEIEINLPENLLKNETLITNNPISNKEAIELINKRKANDENGIISLTTANIGNRATSITYIQATLINEVNQFVEKAGFSIKKFNIGKFSFENNRNIKFNFQKYINYFKFLKFKTFSRPIYSSLALFLMVLTIFLYKSEEKVVYQNPSVKANLDIDKIELNTINQDIKLNVSNDLFASISTSSKVTIFREINSLDTPLKLEKFKSFFRADDIQYDINPVYRLNNRKDTLFQNNISYKKLKTEIINNDEIKITKNLKLIQLSSLENRINYKSLFRDLIYEKNHIKDNISDQDFRKSVPRISRVKNRATRGTLMTP